MDIQTLLIAFMKGYCEDYISRLSYKTLVRLSKELMSQYNMMVKTKSVNEIPYSDRYLTINRMIKTELSKRKGM